MRASPPRSWQRPCACASFRDLIAIDEARAEAETDALISNNFDDRPDLLVASLLGRKKLSAAQMAELYALVEKMDDEA